jgi:hypothetical protein
MVLPLLFSLGLPALAGTGALGATMAGLSVPALAGMGAGLGSFVQTGDLGKGIQTGMASFIGGKVLGGLSGSTSANAINASTQGAAEAAKPGFLSGITSPSPAVSTIASGTPSNLATNFLGTAGANAPAPFLNQAVSPGATKGGAFTAAQQGFFPGMIGQTMTDAQLMQQEYENRAAKKDDDSTVPMPNPMRRTYNPDPYASGGGEGSYFQYARPPRADGSQVQAPYYYADGGYVSTDQTAKRPYMEMVGLHREPDQPLQQYGQRPLQQNNLRPLQQYSQYLGNTYDNFDQKRNEFLRNVQKEEQNTFGQSQKNIFGMDQFQPYTNRNDFGGGQLFGPPPPTMDQAMDQAARFENAGIANRNRISGLMGGIMAFKEGGEVEADQMMAQNGMNEKDVIVSAIEAIKGMSEQPEIVLALFVQKYGEDALRDLVGRVQSGELDDTVDRFESGDKGMVRGPGDGSGVDDMVPATLEGEQDVLLSDGEFVLREKTTDALEKAYGGGFLDMVNRAEEDAPKKLQQMVG